MSRLDDFIRRMTAQKLLLEYVASLLEGLAGPVFELGLGNGRTFDHLREVLPGREIFVFDRAISAHPQCVPDGDHMILGEIRDTLRFCHPRTRVPAALIHVDLGTGDPTADMAKANWLAEALVDHSAVGGYVVADLPIDHPAFEKLPQPDAAAGSRQQIYRRIDYR